jgi:hypothetical protein
MISSATDAYQPAELKFELTRKCTKVLQKYNVPYYVFTKSTIILRDLELHKQYKDNCFVVWSITTCNEKIRRIIEPGTPPTYAMFKSILDNCLRAGVSYIFGAILRLRADIWERMKTILTLLSIRDGIQKYNRIFHFTEPLRSGYNIAADQFYSKTILENLRESVLQRGISFDFPDLSENKFVGKNKKIFNDTNQKAITLMNYM